MNKLILLFFILPLAAFSQNNPDALIENFFNEYEKDYNQALRNAFATNPYIDENGATVSGLIEQHDGLVVQLGEYIEYEMIQRDSFGSRLIEYVYFVYYDRQPVRFVLVAYKSKSDWLFYNIKFDVEYK